jgi:hypothetical protein
VVPGRRPDELTAFARRPNGDLEGQGTGARLWVTARAVAAGVPVEVELQVDAGGRWAGEIAGLAPGTYELVLSAPGRRGGEARVVREVIEVVEP